MLQHSMLCGLCALPNSLFSSALTKQQAGKQLALLDIRDST